MLLVYIQLRVQDLTTLYTGSGDFVNKVGGGINHLSMFWLYLYLKSRFKYILSEEREKNSVWDMPPSQKIFQ